MRERLESEENEIGKSDYETLGLEVCAKRGEISVTATASQ